MTQRPSLAPAPPPLRDRRAALLAASGVGLLAALVVLPLFGAPFKGHDTIVHLYRMIVLDNLIGRGVLYSRWVPDLVLGYGSPLFNFYPPLTSYFFALCYHLMGMNAPLSINLAFALVLVATCAGFYLLAREILGRSGGLLAAIAYVLSPPLLYQTYQRGSLSNALAMAIAPFMLLALLRVARAPSPRRVAVGALGVAAMLVTHIAAAFILVGPLAVVALVAAWRAGVSARRLWSHLAATLGALLGGAALAAFMWLPALIEIRYTQYATALASVDLDYRLFFATLGAWPTPPLAGLANADLPMTVGPALLALAALGLVVTLWRWWRERQSTPWLLLSAAALSAITLYLASAPSNWLWASIGFLRNLQFPWRWLDVAAFLLALCVGALAALGQASALRRGLILGVSVLALFLVALPYVYPPRWHDLPQTPTLTDVTQAQRTLGIYGLTSWGEYMPPTVTEWPQELPFPGADQGATLAERLVSEALPSGSILSSSGGPTWAIWRMRLAQPTPLTLYHYYFPGWIATVDGQPTPLGPDDSGRMTLAVPAGEHSVTVRLGLTPIRAVADALSLLAGIGVVVALVVPSKLWHKGHLHTHHTLYTDSPDLHAQYTENTLSRGALGLSGLVVVLVVLVVAKTAWLDRRNSPFVHHIRGGSIPGVATPAWGTLGEELRLAGARIAGTDQLTLYWQALQPPRANYVVQVELRDARGVPVATLRNKHPGANLASRWEAGQLVRDAYTLPIPQATPPVGYRAYVSVLHPDTLEPLPLSDAPNAQIRDIPVGQTKLPPPRVVTVSGARAVGTVFGEAIALESVALPSAVTAGQPFTYTLVWRSRAALPDDYQVFVHLLKGDGALAADNDGPPRQGLYPTSFWSPGEVIADARVWPLAVAPGDYQVEVGLYHLQSGTRLPVSGAQSELGDRVRVGMLHVQPS